MVGVLVALAARGSAIISTARPPELIVWIVATASVLQMVLQAFDARLSGSWPRFWLWLTGGVVMGGLAAWAEKVKLLGGE